MSLKIWHLVAISPTEDKMQPKQHLIVNILQQSIQACEVKMVTTKAYNYNKPKGFQNKK